MSFFHIPKLKRWSSVDFLFSGWISKASFALPIIGYVILLSDTAVELFSLNHIFENNENKSNENFLIFSTIVRIKLLYIGLIFIFIASCIYKFFKPHPLNIKNNRLDYVDFCQRTFSVRDLMKIAEDLRDNFSHKSGDREKATIKSIISIGKVNSNSVQPFLSSNQFRVRDLIGIQHYYYNKSKRKILLLLTAIGLLGYTLVAIPSFDVFQAVLRSILG